MLNELAEHIVSLQEASSPGSCQMLRLSPSQTSLRASPGISEASHHGTSCAEKEPATSSRPKCKCCFSSLFARSRDGGLEGKAQLQTQSMQKKVPTEFKVK